MKLGDELKNGISPPISFSPRKKPGRRWRRNCEVLDKPPAIGKKQSL